MSENALNVIKPAVTETARSMYSTLWSVPINAVKMETGFWKKFMDLNRKVMLMYQLEQLEKEGLIDALQVAMK